MPRASKTVNALTGHRTKAELALRQASEEKLKTNSQLTERKEVHNDSVAHKEFKRVKKLFEALEKNDDLYSAVLNRYCQLQSECSDFAQKIETLKSRIAQLDAEYNAHDIDAELYYSTYDSLYKSMLAYDRQIMTKRKMLFDIEKENLMTVASGLRSIPKTPQADDENPLLKVLMSDDG